MATNPFTFGDLALDDAFTDREDEVRELASDMRNGQNVLVYAPRRYGKSSLVLRAAQEAISKKVLVGYVDLMRTPTKERLAAALARTIWSDLASPLDQAFEKAASLFRGLRIVPSMDVDPTDGSLRFGFQAGRRKTDIDETIERLLELPAELAAERRRRVVIVFDEFQEIVALDRQFPNLMRAVFQAQPDVAHVYLGSKRHVLERIFNDRNEPFWRSAKRLEIGPIAPAKFAAFLRERFTATGKAIGDDAVERLLGATGGHPYATQELAYSTWELAGKGVAGVAVVEEALVKVLRSEHNHFTGLWDEAPRSQRLALLALADELGQRLALLEEAGFAVGDGTGKPLGIAHASSGITAVVAATGSATNFKLADVRAVWAALPDAYKVNASWVMSPSAAASLANLTDTAGGLVLPSLHAAEPTLYARPVYLSPELPAAAANAKSVVVGDFALGYAVRRVRGIGVQRQDQLYSDNGQIGFRAFARLDGRVVLADALRVLANSAT